MDYLFVNGAPPEDYVCAICTLVARNPHQVSCCGGIFCKNCLKSLESTYKEPSCPFCRKILTNKFFKDSRAERYIEKLQIYCTNNDKGCTWDGKINEIEKHLESCGCEDVECSDCKEVQMRQFLQAHLAESCSKRLFPCPNCKAVGPYSLMTSAEHIDECPDTTVPCPNEGCGKEMLRKALDSHGKVCPKEIVPCPYAIAGCTTTILRESVMEHESQFVQDHLQMSLEKMKQQNTAIQSSTCKQQSEKPHIIFSIKDVRAKMRQKGKYFSPHFYSSVTGYKMKICIQFTDTHLGCFSYVSQGEYDDALEWPFRGMVTVELLNQVEDKSHRHKVIPLTCNRPVNNTDTGGWGSQKFITYLDLKHVVLNVPDDAKDHINVSSSVTPDPVYLLNDALFFRVIVEVQSQVKAWLVTTHTYYN